MESGNGVPKTSPKKDWDVLSVLIVIKILLHVYSLGLRDFAG